MSRYDTEEEQVEAIKAWWTKNGTQTLSLVLVGVLAVSGWRYWTNTQYIESVNASTLFEALQANMQNGSFGEVSRDALKLIQDQPDSPYAVGAAMLYAKYSFEKGESAEALTQLNWVVNTTEDAQLKHTAQLRMARIQADNKDFDDAEKSLAALANSGLSTPEQATFDYVSGLIALAQSKLEMALVAFTKVVKNVEAEKNLMGLAQIQLDDLAQ
ncbi:MAG: tetratricopeptide repeat protein [Gammaproteobacteria bacterium]|nr:tetratricopeptide repeat protein [Gammaproteobacteria bacterium]